MQYKVVPFPQSKDVNAALESIIASQNNDGWEYVNHTYNNYQLAGSDGCFGLGAKPPSIHHIGNVVFKK